MSRWARRTDAPHAAVVEAFRRMGLLVRDVSRLAGLGCDVIVMARQTGQARFVEVKTGTVAQSKQRLTHAEATLAAEAGRWYVVVRSVDEAYALARELLRP